MTCSRCGADIAPGQVVFILDHDERICQRHLTRETFYPDRPIAVPGQRPPIGDVPVARR